MEKSPVYCTGDPDTCETCISIREFTARLKKIRDEKISIPALTHLIEEDMLPNDNFDERKTSKQP